MTEKADRSANIESVYALSPMQEGMLFHTLLRPTSGIYLMQNRYRLEGELHTEAFVRAWQYVGARHPVLRTSFVWKSQKRPLQVVHKNLEMPFEVLDWRDLGREAQEARLVAALQAELDAGFDFGKAPLTRFRLIRLDERTYEFVHSFHHILLDEWCTSSLMMDFLAHYEALVRGETPRLPHPRPYKDYIDWLARQDLPAAEAFWRLYLAGFASATQLGIEERRPGSRTDDANIDDLLIRLDRKSTEILSALAQRHRITLNTIVQGAWALLLSHYSGEREVLFGVTVAGRPPELPNVESIIGLFINTLPLRVPVPPEQPLLPWLVGLLEQNLRLRQYEYAPLVDIQKWSEVERGQSLFQSLFVFENAPTDPTLRDGKMVFRVQDVQDRVHTNYPLTVMSWVDAELPLKLSYDPARVHPETAARLLANLRTLLAGMARDPNARLGDLPLLTSDERQQALVEWNTTHAEHSDFSSYAALFHAQVARTPDAVAVTCEDRRRTYAELNRDANRLAHALAARGIGPEERVVLVDDRGIELLTMIVAVFKAGGAYVPLEPGYPDERVARILELSAPRAIVTRARYRERLERLVASLDAGRRPSVVVLEEVSTESGDDLPERGGPSNLAYVIYTSGSTGVPKGAMVERHGMLNNMLSKFPRLGLGEGVVVAQTASPCFDISVWQFLTALLCGGVVEIVSDDIVRDPARLLEHVERRGIRIIEVVPSVLQGMLDAAGETPTPPALERLRWILPTGEALPAALVRDWLERYPGVPLMNAYGPAECSDDVSLHPLTTPPPADETQVPIGRAVDHLRLYVLDHVLSPLPIGVCGEIFVGGIGVGRGYLGDPRRTAEAFVPNPFENEPGARLYRTGDLGRYRPDGTIEFAGRRDHQVKVRGFRIELGEIEARLTEHAAIAEAAVVVREDRPGVTRLVAYVATTGASIDELRAWLRERVPEYMVPPTFVVLSSLPRTPNGKVDRRALPAPEAGDGEGWIPPRTPTEELLAGIWADVLGVPRVGVEDSFFDLGGHSLMLTQVLSRIRRVFNVEVPLRALFETPTIAAQAREVEVLRGRPTSARPPLVARTRPRDAQLPLSFAQERLWFLAQLEPTAASYNVPAAVRLRGPLDPARLQRSFEAVVRRHESLRTRFVDDGGRPVMHVDTEQPLALELVDRSAAPDEALALLEERAHRPFDLGTGPLLRVTLVRLGEHEHVLLVVLHHIVSDGWSMGVLIREVTELYATDATDAELPPLRIQYADYARWQREWLDGPAFEQQLAYWRQTLGSDPPVLSLPTDHPRPEERSYRGARHAFTLPQNLSGALRALGRAQGVTSFMLLLAGFQTLLARTSGQTDLCIGTPIANRTHVEIEGLVGFFVNTLVLRTDLGGDPSFTALLARVREQVLQAQSYQDLPFERLVQALRPARNLSHTPLFQVMFSLQENPGQAPPVAGLELSAVEVDPGTAQFDLSLHMAHDGDELSGSFEYSTDLFEEPTIRHMADALRVLLEGIAAQPSARLSELPFMEPPPKAVAVEAAGQRPADRRQDAGAPCAGPELEQLAQIWSSVLGRDHVEAQDNFFELGGDSILCLQVVARARQVRVRITTRDMFKHQTLGALAAIARTNAEATDVPDEQGPVTGDAPLTPIQRRFFARPLPNPHHWNQALLLTVAEPLAWPALEAAVHALVRHHDALRLRYVREGSTWRQTHAPDEPATIVHRADLSGVPEAEHAQAIEAHATRWQASLELTAGPVLRVVGFDLGPQRPGRLLLIAHHLVVDGVSWQILLEDLETGYDQAQRGESILLPEKSTSFKRWAEHLENAAPALQEEAASWLELPWDQVASVPADDSTGDRSETATATVTVGLDTTATRNLLETVPEAYNTRVDEVLLTALALALSRRTEKGVVALEVEGHGRHVLDDGEMDLSRTVGWFTSAHPVVLTLAPNAAPGDALKSIKEQLRRIPRHGLPFGVVRELGTGDVAERLQKLPPVGVAFNYLGQWDQIVGAGARFPLAEESPGAEHDPRGALSYELEIDAAVYDGQLEATWRYSGARYRRETVEALGTLWRDALEQLIAHCLSPDAGGYTLSDFPDVQLEVHELDAILGQMD
ncbi:amino acid adenylation domain-containing protein [Pendulispora rubella]|uniref:Amino acid adenylation domain-containing protein n=1 Tax=Pendulispora rubella TaxID=2741070 RepID=A0ABZ2LDD7_9BACT